MLYRLGYPITYETFTYHIQFITYFRQMSKSIDWKDLIWRRGDGQFPLLYEKFTNEPFTGNVTGLKQGSLKDGKRIDKWLEYHENGLLKSKKNYKDGQLDGECLEYYENGQLWIKSNYKDGQQEGEELWYLENGQLEQTRIWEDDKLIKRIYPEL